MWEESSSRTGTEHVLVVDDEPSIAGSLGLILRKFGYDVVVAYNAKSALQSCESFHPDVVISDVVMPGMNGVQMAIRIRQRYPDCRILLLSGMTVSKDLLREARQQGYKFELLLKPTHPEELLSKLQE